MTTEELRGYLWEMLETTTSVNYFIIDTLVNKIEEEILRARVESYAEGYKDGKEREQNLKLRKGKP